jgi:DNA-directed RNA polymerase subunit beta'
MADLTPESTFEALKKNTLDSISSYFPNGVHEGKKQKLVVENLHVDDKLRTDDIASQAEARDKEGTWGVPIRADMKLVDKVTGKVIDERKGAVIARLPKVTNRYGFIVGGNEYQVDHLFRLKSGIYARVQDNGELESEFNLAKSPSGMGFSVKFDPKNKQFAMKYGDSHIPLYPIMKSMGVADDDLEKAWGKEIFAANAMNKKNAGALEKFYERTSEHADPNHDHAQHINAWFAQTVLRPDTTQITVGKPLITVNGEALRLASEKVLGVARGTHKPDDRDSLAFKEVVGVEDFIPEKIQRNSRTVRARLRQTVDHKKTVGEVMPVDLFNRPIHEFFSKGGSVAERSDQTNPLQMLSATRKTTLMSKELGGIKDDNQLTMEMRAVNPSHLGFLDPIHTPESERTGITLHLAAGVRKNGRDLEIPVYDLKAGKPSYQKAAEFHMMTAVLPDQVTWKNGKPVPVASEVKVKLKGGEIAKIPFSKADVVMSSGKGAYNYATNLVPFLNSNNGNRISMADKQMEQAISLKHREAPLVQAKTDHPSDPTHTFEKLIGNFSATRSPVDGEVVSVKDAIIKVKDAAGKVHEVSVYDHFPTNDPKGMMHSEVVVKPGDKLKKGQLVADNNYTKNGTLAIGTNLRVGYIPYKGYNFEDGIVISESAAKKLTSEHLYKKDVEIDPENDHVSKEKFKAYSLTKASQMSAEQWANIGDDGIVKPGTRVLPGQVLIAAVGKNDAKKQTALSVLGKRAFRPYRDKSLTWDEDHVGVVTKVIREPGGRGYKIYVKTEEPAVVGDKLAGRHGNKGIITKILPDHEMPHTADKKPLHILLNPSGVPTRINPGQMLETAASKIAEKTGKPYIVNNFPGEKVNFRNQVEKELASHGISDEEMVYDPKDPRKPLGSVLVGNQYILKLKHQVEKKLTVRGGGTDVDGRAYSDDIDHQPVKGGERGGQGFGALEMYSLLGHNARHNLREMATYKSDAQDITFWKMVQEGHEPPPPKVPFSYDKFTGLLMGLGVNVKKDGTAVRLTPMTTKEIHTLAGNGKNEIKSGNKTLRSKDLREEPGGLFDPHATGGLNGEKWSFMRLAEPVPNPLFVGQNNKPGPVPVLLGMGMKDIDAIMHGQAQIDGKHGGAAIEAALKKIDVDAEITKLKGDLPHLTGAVLDRSNKRLKYLLALKDQGLRPHEAYILHAIPVIPPKFRPATATHDGSVNYAPINGLYKNVALINDQIKNFDHDTFSQAHMHPLRTQLWEAMKALQSVGTYKPVYDQDQSGNRALAGILDTIGQGGTDGQPKEGYFQSKLVKRRQNLSIRSTIVPEPSLGIDEVGVPRGAAMELYKPFVVAQLGRWGVDPLASRDHMKKGTELANKALETAIADRPLLLKRDPALHKFSVMAFKPVLVEGKAIKIHPLVTGGFNADFDGDTMAGTVPVSHEAVQEAKKLFPSKNLFSATDYGVMYTPAQEAIMGLHHLATWGKDSKKTFNSVADLAKAVDKNEIAHSDVVRIKGFKEPTTYGRVLIESRLPRGFSKSKDILHNKEFSVTKGVLGDISTQLAKQHSDHFAKSIDALKDLGNEHSFKFGVSFGLKDLKTLPERDSILAEAHKKADTARKGIKNEKELEAKLVSIYQDATKQIDDAAEKRYKGSDNRLAQMVYTGARGKKEQFRQMIAAPMLVQDNSQRTVPHPITRSYAEGLDFGDYWLTQHGARKGTLDRARGTSKPGSASKDILNTTMSTLVVSQDCKTSQGILMDLTHSDIHDRFTASSYKLKDGTLLKEGTLVTPEVMNRLKNSKVDKVLVRSPLKCNHGQGICAKCFGLNENGKLHDTGVNIGILAGQAMGEPMVQMAMDAFHSGGVATGAGAKSFDTITRLEQLLHMPKKLKHEATIAMHTGPISDIKKDAAGGLDVFVSGVRHYVPADRVRELKVGQQVRRGDTLSHGFVNPHKLLEATKDIHAVQNFLTGELHSHSAKEPGQGDGLYAKKARRRNIEVVVRAATNLTKIKDPGDSDYLPGDVVPRSVVEEHNRTAAKGIHHEPILTGVKEVPSLISQDWMARLNYQQLHTTIQQAAAAGWKSDIHGNHPIPGMAYGAEFGKAPSSKPSHNY